MPRLRHLVPPRDLLVAVVVAALAQVEMLLVADRVDGSLPLHHAAEALILPALALRRTAPLAATAFAAGGLAVDPLIATAPVATGYLALLLVLVSLGWHASLRAGIVGLFLVLASGLVYDVMTGFVWADLVVNVVIIVAAWAGAHLLRRSTDHRVQAEVTADRVAREAVQEERQRIARDLHDSVAHAITLMTLQAGTARERTADAAVRESLRSVESTGRTALADMHRFLQVLGPEGTTDVPGLRDLDDMVAQVIAGGLSVEVVRDGDLDDVPPSVSATVYRVAQEALTNTMRHSTARRVTLTVRNDGRRVSVEAVEDVTPGVRTPSGSTGAGRGLSGLHERLALFQGALDAGRAEDGRWRVHATIPLVTS